MVVFHVGQMKRVDYHIEGYTVYFIYHKQGKVVTDKFVASPSVKWVIIYHSGMCSLQIQTKKRLTRAPQGFYLFGRSQKINSGARWVTAQKSLIRINEYISMYILKRD